MWPKFLNSKWFDRLFASAISIIVVLLAQRLFDKSASAAFIQNELKNKPSFDYVDKRDREIKEDLMKEDIKLKTDLDNTVVEFNNNLREVRNYIININSEKRPAR